MDFHIEDASTDAGAVWKRKKDEGRFCYARDGDMWNVPFQCDWCWLVNLKKREAIESDPQDIRLLGYVRRMNLDIMWSKEPSTVKNVLYQLKKGARLSEELGLPPVILPRGPWEVGDSIGCQLALQILKASQLPGRNSSGYQQFETIRKLRSGFSNAFETGPMGLNGGNMAFKAERGRVYSLHSCPTESIFFISFMSGLLSRMGRLVFQDVGIDNVQMHGLIGLLNEIITDSEATWEDKRKAVMSGTYFLLCYGCSLRGNEGLYLEASSLVANIKVGKDGIKEVDGSIRAEGHVCAPLMGRFKNEQGEQNYMMTMVNESKSGLKFRFWLERLAFILIKEGKHLSAGPAFCNEDGTMITSGDFNQIFTELMQRLQDVKPELFGEGLDVRRTYGVARSFRRGANSRAKEEGVSEELRNYINRWSSVEAKRGQRPSMSMAQHYLETRLILKRTLVYSKAL